MLANILYSLLDVDNQPQDGKYKEVLKKYFGFAKFRPYVFVKVFYPCSVCLSFGGFFF